MKAIRALALSARRFVDRFLTQWLTAVNPGLAGAAAASLEKRLEVLDKRLDVDEPRLCSQYHVACTCWSFCGGAEEKAGAAEATSPASGPPAINDAGLPVVQRSGMDSCPFRYGSPR